ncbi:MAG: hypothetical protein F6K00_31565 [Leptolyngbya sp. SIOISBB]|nr:hypothetical protein [Leptolyngbya sp. SIOISBB]
MYLGDLVFLSYRGDAFEKARRLQEWLQRKGYCEDVILYPPNTICTSNELLLPYDFFELLGKLRDGYSAGLGTYADASIHDADAFVYLDANNYWESSFTQAEVMLWRSVSEELYPATVPERGQPSLGRKLLLPLSGNEEEVRKTAYRSSRKTKRAPLNIGTYYWGKYSKNCFLIGCPNCGNHFLASTKAVYKALRGDVYISCPHHNCGNHDFYFEEGNKQGSFYRKPIRIHHNVKGKVNPLNIDDMMTLMHSNDELPASVGLVTLPGETLKSDGRKVAELYGIAGLALAGLLFIGSLFDGDEET